MACKRSPVRSRYSPPEPKHYTETCGAFFVKANRVRVLLNRESAVHGLQEGHRDYNSPVISTRTKKRLSQPAGRDKRFLFYCAPKRILKS